MLPLNWRLASRHKALWTRARVLQAVRSFCQQRDYLEIETPLRIPAPAPEFHIEAVPSADWFLHTSPELCMKRLLAAGYPRIFQICRCWREGERGRLHVPEFTMLEWYESGSDYRSLMQDCEDLLRHVALTIGLSDRLTYQDRLVDLSGHWLRLSVREAFDRFADSSLREAVDGGQFEQIWVEQVESRLPAVRPVFVFDYPAEMGSLAKLSPEDPSVAERVELYVAGMELANGFTELVDAEEQRARFEREEAFRRSAGRRPYPTPERFLQELTNAPPSAGMALGIDRLVMLMTDAAAIDDVLAFTPEEL
jgi:lysyl-tRNA synthetase class 2